MLVRQASHPQRPHGERRDGHRGRGGGRRDIENADEAPADSHVGYEVLCRQHHRRKLTAARAKAVSLAPEPLPFG